MTPKQKRIRFFTRGEVEQRLRTLRKELDSSEGRITWLKQHLNSTLDSLVISLRNLRFFEDILARFDKEAEADANHE